MNEHKFKCKYCGNEMTLVWSGTYNPNTGEGVWDFLRYKCPKCMSCGPTEYNSSRSVPLNSMFPGASENEKFRVAVEQLDGRMIGQFTTLAEPTPKQRLDAACVWYSRLKAIDLPDADRDYFLAKKELNDYLHIKRKPYIGWCRCVEMRAKKAADAAELLEKRLHEFERCKDNLRKCQRAMPVYPRLKDGD